MGTEIFDTVRHRDGDFVLGRITNKQEAEVSIFYHNENKILKKNKIG